MKETVTRVVDNAGRISYLQDGQNHRENGPAYIAPDGYLEYRRNEWVHRENGPAVFFSDGTMQYYENGTYIKGVEP